MQHNVESVQVRAHRGACRHLICIVGFSCSCIFKAEGLQLLSKQYTVIEKRGLEVQCMDPELLLLKKDGLVTDAECHVSCMDNEMDVCLRVGTFQ